MSKQAKVVVVGSGGREHALAWKLSASESVKKIFCLPGNGGTALAAKCQNVAIEINDFKGIVDFCRQNKVDLVVIGPDNPLADGIVDYLRDHDIRVFGPRKESARLEWSKAYAKRFMTECGLPTAQYAICASFDEAREVVRTHEWARVIKADGLALGKGVFVCDNEAEAITALNAVFHEKRFGAAGQRVVIEEKLDGEELSLLLLCDGNTFLPLQACQDHKRRFDEDKGPNTGGMGAYSPVRLYDECAAEIEEKVLAPLKLALLKGKLDYQGVLYLGLMVSRSKAGDKGTSRFSPYVLEFNARFGDPETQAVLPRMRSDLYPLLYACTEGNLKEQSIDWAAEAACCVVAVAKSYPESSSKGKALTVGDLPPGAMLFHAGTKLEGGQVVTNGGRVLAATALAPTMEGAKALAYRALDSVSFEDM
ncbi:MAG TPA: phosphoribosylamine--glycine ligase, partial [Candidatus Obscuribacterales bacterium]